METQGVAVDRRSVSSGGALSQVIKLSEILMGSNRQETIRAVLEKTSDIFPECRICFIGLKDGKLSVEDGIPPNGHGVGEVITTKMGKFFLKSVIDGGKTIVVNNPHSDKRLDYLKALIERYQISAIMFSPLRCADGTNFGLLVVDALKERIFSPEDKQLVKTISRIASSALCRELQEEARLAKAVEMERLATLGKNSLRMAHALRNRLTSIGGFASRSERIITSNKEVFGEVLEEKLKALERYSRIIVDDIEMMEYIVSTVLDISKPAVLNLERCSVNNLLMKEIGKYRVSYSGVSFYSNLDWRLSGVSLMIDRYGLQICISDLVSNAYEAGATIVTIETKLTKTQCIIAVINNGHDIDPRDQEDIFEMFMTKGKPRGTGLGLPTARHIVNGHGGEIKVHSKDGKTVFEITLPRYRTK
ncbi:MAG: ATP-binding protein [Patescibacteria group bacterium]